jgi:hypothetical protein
LGIILLLGVVLYSYNTQHEFSLLRKYCLSMNNLNFQSCHHWLPSWQVWKGWFTVSKGPQETCACWSEAVLWYWDTLSKIWWLLCK